MRITFALIATSAVVTGCSLWAQTGQTQDQKKVPVRIHGFLLGNFTARTGDAHPPGQEGGRFLWADERLRLEVSSADTKGNLSFMFKGDLFHDAVRNRPDGVVREAYLDYSRAWLGFRLGRQIVTWGTGDLIFINDVFPKDWSAFFSGRPLEYLKVGVDGAKLHFSTPAVNVELVVIPFFEPDNLPSPGRFFFFDPFSHVQDRSLKEPATTTGNNEFALRLYRRLHESDVSLYAYRGYWRTPSFRPGQLPRPSELRGFYPGLSVYGAGAQRNVGAGLLSLEAGYYDSVHDRRGADPTIPNSQFRFLVGYQRQLASEFSVGTQYYSEILTDYAAYRVTLPSGLPRQDRMRHLLTLRLTKFFKYQTWKLSWFSFFSPSDQDGLVIPELWHAFTDRLSLTIGANILAGRHPTTFLGQFRQNDNVYALLRFDF